MKTPVLGVNHPYRFYAQAQIDDDDPDTGYVGSGKIVPKNCEGVVQLMKKDLAAARWQVLMAEKCPRVTTILLASLSLRIHGDMAKGVVVSIDHMQFNRYRVPSA